MTAELKALGVYARHGSKVVLEDVTMEARPGAVTVVLGPNGAGKTTLLRVLAGLHVPAQGRVFIGNRDVYKLPRMERARLIAYVPAVLESPGLGQTVEEFVAASRYPLHPGPRLGPQPGDLEEAQRQLRRVEAEKLAQQSLGKLSSGEKQRTLLAHALARDADVLLVDEPTSFLDLRGRLLVYKLLHEEARRGRVVVAATHDMMLAGLYADQVVLLSQGRIVAQGPPKDILHPRLLERVFQVKVEMTRLGDKHIPVPVDIT
ncbi:ABC-type cobalamin/Fe3+-siderophores transport systems, ATPase components [Pyrodictium delaneyi]|uniref:ABC-type cobalamin/Fe3+-siderophores transport systems, ATPase components n=1 Tax=Pyrodictium delaneyi TaxID=1273541 RepID=A0A0N7JD87_9CREN|nr:ABC transporter ATP-binding protein [Pyrodictium delaneyi]ALL01505.1 ABC-type cobalamin/Fe3+-siderophores transport systems, ATPase components [Pyrodictium delaneyi]OWJ54588.1 hypothetical protein Pdsh_06050 [Pyrodictium delaneyi]